MPVLRDTSDRERLFFRIKCELIFGVVTLVFILTVSAFAYLPALHFQKIFISGLQQFSPEVLTMQFTAQSLHSFVGRYFGVDSVLTWMFFRPRILRDMPLASVDVVARWFARELEFRVVERERAMIWCIQARCFWIDSDGVVLAPASEGQGQLVPTIIDDSVVLPVVGDLVLKPEYLSTLHSVFGLLSTSHFAIQRATLERATFDLRVVTDGGPDFLFNLRVDPRPVLPSLDALRPYINFSSASVVDLRVPSKVFY